MEETKICKTCKEEKTIDWFYFRPDTKKYKNDCEICRSKKKGHNSLKKKKEDIFNNLTIGLKECGTCKKLKPLDNYHNDKHTLTKLASRCKDCILKYNINHVEDTKFRRINNVYDLSKEDYDKLLVEQNNACAICKISFVEMSSSKKDIHIDHCHNTGKTRGILCKLCNIGIGLMKDSVQNLQNAINYLNKYKQ